MLRWLALSDRAGRRRSPATVSPWLHRCGTRRSACCTPAGSRSGSPAGASGSSPRSWPTTSLISPSGAAHRGLRCGCRCSSLGRQRGRWPIASTVAVSSSERSPPHTGRARRRVARPDRPTRRLDAVPRDVDPRHLLGRRHHREADARPRRRRSRPDRQRDGARGVVDGGGARVRCGGRRRLRRRARPGPGVPLVAGLLLLAAALIAAARPGDATSSRTLPSSDRTSSDRLAADPPRPTDPPRSTPDGSTPGRSDERRAGERRPVTTGSGASGGGVEPLAPIGRSA